MSGDRDDFGLARDVATYFAADASEIGTKEPTAAKSQVLLRSGDRELSIANDVFSRVWVSAFWASAPWADFGGSISAAGLARLAIAAKREGLKDMAERMDLFSRGMTGVAAVNLQDGSPWRVPVKVAGNVTGLPAPMGGAPKKIGTVATPNIKPVPTAAAFEDIADYFSDENEVEGE